MWEVEYGRWTITAFIAVSLVVCDGTNPLVFPIILQREKCPTKECPGTCTNRVNILIPYGIVDCPPESKAILS